MGVTRVLVCGDRNWSDTETVFRVIADYVAQHGRVTIIEGAATGADYAGARAAYQMGLPHEQYPADWKKHGKAAGPIRNRQMLDTKPNLVLAFHDDIEHSRGTKDCIKEAARRGVPVRLVTSPRRATPSGPDHATPPELGAS